MAHTLVFMYAPLNKGDQTARVPRQEHFYRLNYLRLPAGST
jgi:hypothetical protein